MRHHHELDRTGSARSPRSSRRRAAVLCTVAALSLAACGGSDDSTDADDATTSTATEAPAEETTTTEADDEAGSEPSELDPTGDTVEFAGATIEVAGGSLTPVAGADEAELELELEMTNGSDDDQANFYGTATLVVDDEDVDLDGAGYVELDPGKSTKFTYTGTVPADAEWDDMVLEIGEDGVVPAVYPLTEEPPASPLPASIEPDETFELTDGAGQPFSLVVDRVTRTLDTPDGSGTVIRAADGTTFLVVEASITTGVANPYIESGLFRMQAAGETTDPVVSSPGYQDENTLQEWRWVLALPDDGEDAVVRIGDPALDPNYLEWPVPFADLGGEVADGLGGSGSSSGSDSGSGAEDEG